MTYIIEKYGYTNVHYNSLQLISSNPLAISVVNANVQYNIVTATERSFDYVFLPIR